MSALLAYTTKIPETRSISEITSMLSAAGATGMLQEFDGAGNTLAISFKIKTKFGEITFRLPSDVPAVDSTLKAEHKARNIDRRFANDSKHSRRVAWRILRHWLEAQLALIKVGQAKVEQVFLPYAQDAKGKTVFETLEQQRFNGLALPEK